MHSYSIITPSLAFILAPVVLGAAYNEGHPQGQEEAIHKKPLVLASTHKGTLRGSGGGGGGRGGILDADDKAKKVSDAPHNLKFL